MSEPRRRIRNPERAELAETLKGKYATGRTVRQLAESYTLSYGLTHCLLREAGAEMRSRGGKMARRG